MKNATYGKREALAVRIHSGNAARGEGGQLAATPLGRGRATSGDAAREVEGD